ncbi:hypothetical protein NDN08_008057 [Rhodosorus marinus]|uniref:Mitochondrial import inner membrane translocase subunit TIM22 n=1 Tax=Rhodosorus marinus TaxID=101924 RepID=A0AAV8UZD7_9RHOD|nr:hypothetical protein NDN08_008057 [Rhodosorus marinus]
MNQMNEAEASTSLDAGAPGVAGVPGAAVPGAGLSIETLTESCVFKSGLSAVAGAGLGVFFGLLFGGYSNAVDEAVDFKGSTRQKLSVGFRSAAKAMGSYARSFSAFGMVYSGSECAIEKIRAKHDIWNAVNAGCVTGATMASTPRSQIGARARASQMAVGCAGMAAFSAAIDYYIEFRE